MKSQATIHSTSLKVIIALHRDLDIIGFHELCQMHYRYEALSSLASHRLGDPTHRIKWITEKERKKNKLYI